MKKIRFVKEYRAIKLNKQNASSQTFKYREGDVLDEVLNEEAQWLIDNGFAEEVKESGWWKPQNGEAYYSLNSYGSVSLCTCWKNDHIDRWRYSMGNIFKTEKAAERYCDYRKAIAIVRQDEGVLTPEKVRETLNQYGTVYTVGTNATALSVKHFYNVSAGAVYFDTLYNANISIGNHLDEWEIITNYDWSRE